MLKKNADAVVQAQIRSWGQERGLYTVCLDELRILVAAGAIRNVVNRDNGDGTLYNEVLYEGRTFACSSTELVH